MKWKFGKFTLDTAKVELTDSGSVVPIEPYPLDVLVYLIRHSDRVVSRDELVEQVWKGRVISDSAVSSAIKHARKAVRDNGADQHIIKTVHGRGFRFVAEFETAIAPGTISSVIPGSESISELPTAESIAVTDPHGTGKPSIAILKFSLIGEDIGVKLLSSALPAELISGLSRTRWLRVIARGSSFQFDSDAFDATRVGKALGARYLLSGLIEAENNQLTVTVELQSAINAELVWSERMTGSLDQIPQLRRHIVNKVKSEIEQSIPDYEAEQSKLLRPDQFDAWSHYHLGLNRIFKYSPGDNVIAAEHFNQALALDPDFARAYAGLSFIHFQNGFLHDAAKRTEHQRTAFQLAQSGLERDATDAFINYNVGRAHWLAGDFSDAQDWLNRALEINPSYAHGHYFKGLVHVVNGQPEQAIELSTAAESFSPLDPMCYAFLAVRAWGDITMENFEHAVELTEKAGNLPSAFVLVDVMAALANELHGDRNKALQWRDRALSRHPGLSITGFLNCFPFKDSGFRNQITQSLKRLNFVE